MDETTLPEDVPVAILAGGLATRLGSITQDIPKSLVPIRGKPFLAHQIELLRSRGVRRVVLCVGHLGEMIEDAFGDGRAWDISIAYSRDGASLLGTGGALLKALPLLGPVFFVLYGDSYLPIDFTSVLRAFRTSGKPALMTVYANHGQWDRSNVKFRAGRIEIHDKRNPASGMNHIDYGLGVVTAEALRGCPEGKAFDLADAFSALVGKGQLAGHEVFERFYEIGSPQGLADFENLVASKEARLPVSPLRNLNRQ